MLALYQQGRYAEAEASARQALSAQSGNLLAWQILGAALQKQDRLEEALTVKQATAERFPDDADAHANLGNAQMAKGDLPAAEVSYRRALALRPDFPACQQQLALVRYRQGGLTEAEALCHELALANPVAATLLGAIIHAQGKLPEAARQLHAAIQRFPHHADAHIELGRLQRVMHQLGAAETSYRQALSLAPFHYDAHIGIGLVFNAQNRLVAAEDSFRQAIQIDPRRPEAYVNLANTLKDQGRLAEAIASYEQALTRDPHQMTALSNRLFALQHLAGEAARQRQAAEAYGQQVSQSAPLQYRQWACDPKPESLRVGLVSGDLRVHPVGYFLESLLACGAFRQIDWRAYVTHPIEDALSDRLRPHCRQWTSLVGLTDAEAAARIHADGVHVLIDLSGHTGSVRLPLFACRPAPVQVSWLGYFATTGMVEIDYLLADPVSVPVGMEAPFIETVWRLPETRLCFSPPQHAPPVSGLPAETKGCVTFGSFQNLAKANDEVLALWAQVLRAVPTSKLRWQSRQLGDAALADRIRRKLEGLGVAGERITRSGETPRADYLAAYAEVDMMLDTFPFTGGTTTCEALWMGVPTLTLAGDTLIGRQGASLLTAARLPDWVADSPAEYVAKAVQWSDNLPGLGEVRAGLREQVRHSPLCDARRFAQHLEAALWEMWNERGVGRI